MHIMHITIECGTAVNTSLRLHNMVKGLVPNHNGLSCLGDIRNRYNEGCGRGREQLVLHYRVKGRCNLSS